MISTDEVVEYMVKKMSPEEVMEWMENFEVNDIWHAWFLTFVKWKYIVAMKDHSASVWDIGRSWTTCGLCRMFDCEDCPIGRDYDNGICFVEYDQWYEYGDSPNRVLDRIEKEYNKYVFLQKM